MGFVLLPTLRYRHRGRVPDSLSQAHGTVCVSQVESDQRTCLLFSLIIPFGGYQHYYAGAGEMTAWPVQETSQPKMPMADRYHLTFESRTPDREYHID
ncbi:hypothetical protein CGRA01v4_14754 [Colletotrichum graminicola]|nr:hypothetical protein CGRA01v4_14754 [Colletotrichum graminicola]